MNSIELNGIEITAKTKWYLGCVLVTLVIVKGGVEIAKLSPCDIDTKIKPENRHAVKALSEEAAKSHVMSEEEIAEKKSFDRVSREDREYKAHYNRVTKAMNA